MNKENNNAVFIINTEYGLLISLLYYKEMLEPKGIIPHFVFFKSSNLRFNGIDFEKLPGKYYIYKNELNNSVIFPNNDFLNFDYNKNVCEIIINNPAFLISQVMLLKIKKNSPLCKTTVLADSAGIDDHITPLRLFYYTLKLYLRRFLNFYNLPLKFLHYHNFGKYVDLFIAHRNLYNKEFLNSNFLLAKIHENKYLISDVFKFKIEKYLDYKFIFFTQPLINYSFVSNKTKENYLKLLNDLSYISNKNAIKIVLKLHPSENISSYEKYKNEYLTIDEGNNIPAEIIVNALDNKIFLSVSSSSSCFDLTKNNKHFWIGELITNKKPIIDSSYSYINTFNNYEEFKAIFKN
jgi:hypothetical protein